MRVIIDQMKEGENAFEEHIHGDTYILLLYKTFGNKMTFK